MNNGGSMDEVILRVPVEELKKGVREAITIDLFLGSVFSLSGIFSALIFMTVHSILVGLAFIGAGIVFLYDSRKLKKILERIEDGNVDLKFKGVTSAYWNSVILRFSI